MTAYQFIEIAIATTLSTFYHVSATDLQHCVESKNKLPSIAASIFHAYLAFRQFAISTWILMKMVSNCYACDIARIYT